MIRNLALASLILALAACAQPSATTAPTPGAAPPRPVTPPPEVPIPRTPPPGEPRAYLNLPPANLRGLLGTPQFVRQDGASEMWRYDGASCRAFFFFQGPAGSQTVRHVETLPAGAASAADPLCLSALRAARPAT
jgi:hypothetical protein